MERYFTLRGEQVSPPLATMWIKALQNMIHEDGDSMEVFESGIGCNWLYAVRISTTQCNFTDDVKGGGGVPGIVPQMCDLKMNLGLAWEETSRQGFLNLKEEIARAKKVQSQKDAERQASYNRLIAAKIKNEQHVKSGGSCNHAVGWCNCR